MTEPNETVVRAFVKQALQLLYAGDKALLRWGPNSNPYAAEVEDRGPVVTGRRRGTPTRPISQVRSNERAVAARFAIHAHPLVAGAFGEGCVVDVEYSRVLEGAWPKIADGANGMGVIYPDLIFHRRAEALGNALVIEIKLGGAAGPPKGQACPPADPDDMTKVMYLTGGAPSGMLPYAWGLCLDLRPDRAFLHWVRGGRALPVETWWAPQDNAVDV